MEKFEIVMILNADTKDEIIKGEIKKYTDLLQDWCKTKKVKVDDMGKKTLAYEIKEHKIGYYVMFKFMAHPAHITELERQLRIDDNILKFVTVKTIEDEMEDDLEDYIPNDEEEKPESEQKPDALDVLLGFADYKKKGVK